MIRSDENHTQQLKAAREAGYMDTKQGEYKPAHIRCTCIACRTEYLRGSDNAFREMIGKRH